jgi:hypothetical protein
MARGEVSGKKPAQTADRVKLRRGAPCADPKAVEPTDHSEPAPSDAKRTPLIRGAPPATAGAPKYRRKPKRVDPNALALSIRAFCVLHDLSEAQFYKMRREGWGPSTMKVGSRTLISHESARQWRAAREAATAAAVKAPPPAA